MTKTGLAQAICPFFWRTLRYTWDRPSGTGSGQSPCPDEWLTVKKEMQHDRLPERVKITLGIMDQNNEREIKYTVQTLLFMQEKLDFSK